MSTWDMVEAAGIEGADVDDPPGGTVTVVSADGQSKVVFGESTMDGDGRVTEPNGYDWTAYRFDREDDTGPGCWVTSVSDWAETDEDMTAALKRYAS